MTDAYRDGNGVHTMIAALDTDGTSIVRIKINAANNGLKVSNGTSGTDHGTVNAKRDGNQVPVLLAVSSADGVTPVEVYADSGGNLLIQST